MEGPGRMIYYLAGGLLLVLAFVAILTLSNPLLPTMAAVTLGFSLILIGKYKREHGHGRRR
jgi:hypothetical protein